MSRRLLGLIALVSLLSVLSCRKDEGTGPPPAKELDSPYLLGHTTGSQNYVHVFAYAGTYPYHCRLHTTSSHRMAGTVFVVPQGAESVFVSIFEGAYHPSSATVRPNGYVRWQNFDEGTHHSVTSD